MCAYSCVTITLFCFQQQFTLSYLSHNPFSLSFLQLSKTNEHLKQIFNVPETVDRTEKLIHDGHYLQAHKKYVIHWFFSAC